MSRYRPPQPRSSAYITRQGYDRLDAEQGEVITYRIVGPDEFDVDKGWISMDSPVARALMKKSLDDEVEMVLLDGVCRFIITAICY